MINVKEALERSLNKQYILKGMVLGKEHIKDKIYARVMYKQEKILIQENDLSTHEVRDKVGVLMGAEIDFIITKYDEELKAYIGNRNLVKEKLEEIIEKKNIKIGDKANIKIIVVAKNFVIAELYGNEIKILARKLKQGWVEDAREVIKIGEEKEAVITSIEPLEVEIINKEIEFDEDKYKIGDEYVAKVIGVPSFGIMTKINNEREVLCYKVDWRDNLQIDDYVVIQIKDINAEKKLTYGFLKRKVRR